MQRYGNGLGVFWLKDRTGML